MENLTEEITDIPDGVEKQLRKCVMCQEVKGYRSFAKIDKSGRRKNKCNSCIRAESKAKSFGLTVEEMEQFKEGPCVVCGSVGNVKAYVDPTTERPIARVCGTHRGYFRAFLRWEELVLFKEISENFPAWLDILKKHGLHLFKID